MEQIRSSCGLYVCCMLTFLLLRLNNMLTQREEKLTIVNLDFLL